ncbi:MAG: hypothetical protein Q9M28_00800 [Mariprofundaceae bacterium]|nr:hypothetical protein [Mariprofundaceae bacterium]
MSPEADPAIFELLMWFAPFAVLFWWIGYVATKRLRIEKNKEREPALQRALARKKAEEEATHD